MTAADWDDTRREFRRIAAREGVRKIAEDVPACHATVYRIISGETGCPSRAVKQGIERVVESRKETPE